MGEISYRQHSHHYKLESTFFRQFLMKFSNTMQFKPLKFASTSQLLFQAMFDFVVRMTGTKIIRYLYTSLFMMCNDAEVATLSGINFYFAAFNDVSIRIVLI